MSTRCSFSKPIQARFCQKTHSLQIQDVSVKLQGVQHFKDIQYTPSMTYGELFMQNEYEMSCYNLDEANVEGQRQRFDLYQQVFASQHLVQLSSCL